MKNNSKAAAKRIQIVMSEKARTFVKNKTVTTKAGKTITVNVYKKNKNAKPIRTVLHPLPPPTDRKFSEDAKTMGRVTSAPVLSEYQIERNKKRSEEREANKNRAQLIYSGTAPFVGSIRNQSTGANRNNIV